MVGRTLAATLALAGLGLSACARDEDPAGIPANNASYSFALTPDSLFIQPGTQSAVSLLLTRDPGFYGEVSFSAVDAPAGASITVDRQDPGRERYSIGVVAFPTMTPGTHTITIRGTTPGKPDQTATLRLIVPTPGFFLTLFLDTLFVEAGTLTATTLVVRRDPAFTSPVTLTASGAPAGVSISFNQVPGTSVYSVAVTTAASLSQGIYDVVIRASTPDRPAQSVPLRLAVVPPGPGGNTRVRFCRVAPIFFAFQDGQGPWIGRTAPAREFGFDLTSGRGAFVFTFLVLYSNGDTGFATNVFYGTQSELNLFSVLCENTDPYYGFVTGSFANAGDDPKVALGGWATRERNFSLPLPAAPWDVIAWTEERSGLPNRAIIRRDQSLPANSVLPVFDFNSAEAFNLVPRRLSFSAEETQHVSASLYTANGTWAPLMCYDFNYNYDFCSVSSHNLYPTLPAPRPGDSYSFSLWSEDRAITSCFTDGVDRTLPLPPILGPVDVTIVSTLPSLRLRTRYTRQPEYRDGLQVTWYNALPTTRPRQLQLNVSAAYLGTAAVVDLSTPDLSGVSGWNAQWGLLSLPNPQLLFEARGSSPVSAAGTAECRGASSSPFERLQPGSTESRFAWLLREVFANGTVSDAPRSQWYAAARKQTGPAGLSVVRER